MNRDDGLSNESPGIVDRQAPRVAYTVNDAICPRGIFVEGFRDSHRPYRFVRTSEINRPNVILATESRGSHRFDALAPVGENIAWESAFSG